jgi:hypothetical protein
MCGLISIGVNGYTGRGVGRKAIGYFLVSYRRWIVGIPIKKFDLSQRIGI